MKISICDICNKENKIVKATHKIGIKSQFSKIKLDSCVEHKGFFKGCKTYTEAEEKAKTVLYKLGSWDNDMEAIYS